VAVKAIVTPMRTALTVLTVVALVSVVSACSMGKDQLSAQDREKRTVDTVTEAVPLVQEALDAAKVTVDGRWSSCPGGVGHVYSGGGSVVAPVGNVARQLDVVREALTGAGFTEGTLVEGLVSVTRDEVDLNFQLSPARGRGVWAVSYAGPCQRYGGDDEDYVQAQNLEPTRTLLP